MTLESSTWGSVQCNLQHTEDLEPRSQKKSGFHPPERHLYLKKSLFFPPRAAIFPLEKKGTLSPQKSTSFSSKHQFYSKKSYSCKEHFFPTKAFYPEKILLIVPQNSFFKRHFSHQFFPLKPFLSVFFSPKSTFCLQKTFFSPISSFKKSKEQKTNYFFQKMFFSPKDHFFSHKKKYFSLKKRLFSKNPSLFPKKSLLFPKPFFPVECKEFICRALNPFSICSFSRKKSTILFF